MLGLIEQPSRMVVRFGELSPWENDNLPQALQKWEFAIYAAWETVLQLLTAFGGPCFLTNQQLRLTRKIMPGN